jgi:hypothetical protein
LHFGALATPWLKSFGSNDRVCLRAGTMPAQGRFAKTQNRPSRIVNRSSRTAGARHIWDLRPDPPNQVLLKGCTPKCSAVSGRSRVSLMSLATASDQLSPRGSDP